MAHKEEWAEKIMSFITHEVWKTATAAGGNKEGVSISDMLKLRVIEMKERRKKHAINKVVQENPHLGYDGVPKKQAPILNLNDLSE
jgi:hypothetical protein